MGNGRENGIGKKPRRLKKEELQSTTFAESPNALQEVGTREESCDSEQSAGLIFLS